jgi:hypothetical protein
MDILILDIVLFGVTSDVRTVLQTDFVELVTIFFNVAKAKAEVCNVLVVVEALLADWSKEFYTV